MVTLLTTTYNKISGIRENEFLESLLNNMKHQYIEKIVIFLEKTPEEPVNSNILTLMKMNSLIEIQEIRERPMFSELFNYSFKNGNGIYAICNADIMFPDWNAHQFKHLLDVDYDKTSVVLTKWNNQSTLSDDQKKMSGHVKTWENGNTYKSEWVEGWSQDTWVFKVPFKDYEKINTDIYMGTVECDCYMNNELSKIRNVINPAMSIISLHNHSNWVMYPQNYNFTINGTTYERSAYNKMMHLKGFKTKCITLSEFPKEKAETKQEILTEEPDMKEKKIAYCFLIKDKINKLDIWEKYFENNYDKCDIYIHAKFPDKVKQKWTKQYLIEEHAETSWGDIYDALSLLYKKVLDNGNYKAIFCTESHIPVKNFQYCYDYVTKHNKSHVKWLEQKSRTPGEKGTLIMQYERYINNAKRVNGFMENIEIKHWYYNETYTILNRKHCKMFYEEEKYIKIFKGCGMWDENYPMYMFSINNCWDELVNEQTCHVNWSELSLDKNGMRSPKEYKMISPEELKNWIQPNFLFARKIHPDCEVDKFLNILWYNKGAEVKPVVFVLSNTDKSYDQCISVYGKEMDETSMEWNTEERRLYVNNTNSYEDEFLKVIYALSILKNIDYTNVIIFRENEYKNINIQNICQKLVYLNDDYIGPVRKEDVSPTEHVKRVSETSEWKTKNWKGRVVPFISFDKWISFSKKSVEAILSSYNLDKLKTLKTMMKKDVHADVLLARALHIHDIKAAILK